MKITSINYNKSIKTGKLVFKKNFEYYFDFYFQIFLNLALTFAVIINIFEWKNYGTNEKSFIIIFIIFTSYSYLLLYKKLTECKLSKLRTNKTIVENKKLVLNYLRENRFKIYQNKYNVISAIDDLGNTGLLTWKKNHIVILCDDNEINFTILTERNKVNFPSLFDKYYLKKDLINKSKIGTS